MEQQAKPARRPYDVRMGVLTAAVVVMAGVAAIRAVDMPRRPSMVVADPGPVAEVVPAAPPEMRPSSAADLDSLFARLGYDLTAVAEHGDRVPWVVVSALPPDIDEMDSVGERKDLFLRAILPTVLHINAEIAADRNRLLALETRLKGGEALTGLDLVWVQRLGERYGLSRPTVPDLLTRVDMVPPSLALAQAAEESGWGTSRFAVQGNAMYGQWAPDGMVGHLPGGKLVRVKAFDSLPQAVGAYIQNLNSNNAYRDFRRARARLRATGRPIDGQQLVGTLVRYSERGEEYLQDLRTIIRNNNLTAFDQAVLNPLITVAMMTEPGADRQRDN